MEIGVRNQCFVFVFVFLSYLCNICITVSFVFCICICGDFRTWNFILADEDVGQPLAVGRRQDIAI